ncbi:ABC transporter permease [Erysipelothrix sp. HDW6C]|uniref:ABC transporter permease n=1 Tax=Erysipelothrix sp. HDW6C TaxID=2714930 RepID=UPI00140BEC18|nr:ABC transporter permease [Erysipelothrix sp. HDW6C]QIK70773.1 ABC transporter permease [Erysipelothrix sp. HDW6C]
MKNLRSLTNYNLKLVLRDTGPMLMAFLMPIGFYILFGYMLKDLKVADGSMGELLIPLYIIIIIGNAVLNVFGVYYVNAKETGNIQKYKFLGISELKYAASLFAATMILQVIVIIAFNVFTFFYAGYAFPIAHILPVFLTIMVIEVYHFAFTFLLSSIIKKAAAYNSIALAFYMFQMFLGGLHSQSKCFPYSYKNLFTTSTQLFMDATPYLVHGQVQCNLWTSLKTTAYSLVSPLHLLLLESQLTNSATVIKQQLLSPHNLKRVPLKYSLYLVLRNHITYTLYTV